MNVDVEISQSGQSGVVLLCWMVKFLLKLVHLHLLNFCSVDFNQASTPEINLQMYIYMSNVCARDECVNVSFALSVCLCHSLSVSVALLFSDG